jgi:hypothetical protein
LILVLVFSLSACNLPFSGAAASSVSTAVQSDDDDDDPKVTPAKTISKDGEYTLDGVIDGQVLVTAENVTLILDGATINCDDASAILGKDGNGDKAVQNLTVELRGESTVTSGTKHGIQGKDDLTITGTGSVNITAVKDGLHAGDILTVKDGNINVLASYEGMEAPNIVISGGNSVVHSSDDGLNAATDDTDTLKPSIEITGGILTLYTGSDGIDSNGTLAVTGGTVAIFINAPRDGEALDVNTQSDIVPALVVSAAAKAGDEIAVGDLYAVSLETDVTSFALIIPGLKDGETYTVTSNGAELAKVAATTTVVSQMGGAPGGLDPNGPKEGHPEGGKIPEGERPSGDPSQGGFGGRNGERPADAPAASDGQTT